MKVTIKDRDALLACSPELLEKYMIKKGWTLDQGLWVLNNDKILIPNIVDAEYVGKVSWILMVIERVENRSQLDIWCDITNRTLFFGPGTEEALTEIDELLKNAQMQTDKNI